MSSVWSALVWKEWHEHKWKLASLVAIVVGVLALTWRETRPGDFFSPLVLVLVFFLPLASAFVAMSAAASERSRGTLPLLQALPIAPRGIAALKLTFATVTALVPLWIAIGISTVAERIAIDLDWRGVEHAADSFGHLAGGFGTGFWAVGVGVLMSLVAISLVVWLAALGVNSASEVRAGAIGLAVAVGLWTVVVTAMNWFSVIPEAIEPLQPAFAALPGGQFFAVSENPQKEPNWPGIAFCFLAAHAPLACWYVLRFGRAERAAAWSPQPAAKNPNRVGWLTRPRWLAPPRRTPLTAIIWKQFRESSPIMLVGFACAAALLTVSLAGELWSSHSRLAHAAGRLRVVGEWATVFFTMFGFLSGLVAGVGVGTTDFDQRRHTFWRSRPISPDLWFAAKYLTGIAMLLTAFGLPALLGFAALAYGGAYEFRSLAMTTLYFSTVLAYTSAVFAGCAVRQPIYAAILGIAFSLSLWLIGTEKLQTDLAANTLLIVSTVVLAAAAWLFVRFDWALRR